MKDKLIGYLQNASFEGGKLTGTIEVSDKDIVADLKVGKITEVQIEVSA